ncbi:hypothetical protein B0H17DRAFT_1218963 [Mycena rosella]|uniref:Uncharacterized protein n=1 Tax=Mycena rosella TaxID=1033263 RepID=A0AAD7FJR3_MYCRO|nr:hypothetical protein B0H17DRAFT_1218963 [Mycena rosella]
MSSHPFNIPTIPPEQVNADPQHIPASDLIAQNARKRKAESQMSERANKNMRSISSWEAADFEELGWPGF